MEQKEDDGNNSDHMYMDDDEAMPHIEGNNPEIERNNDELDDLMLNDDG